MRKEQYMRMMSYGQSLNKIAYLKRTNMVKQASVNAGPYTRALMIKQQASIFDTIGNNWDNAVQSWKSSKGQAFWARLMTFLHRFFGGTGTYGFTDPAAKKTTDAAGAAQPGTENPEVPTERTETDAGQTPAARPYSIPHPVEVFLGQRKPLMDHYAPGTVTAAPETAVDAPKATPTNTASRGTSQKPPAAAPAKTPAATRIPVSPLELWMKHNKKMIRNPFYQIDDVIKNGERLERLQQEQKQRPVVFRDTMIDNSADVFKLPPRRS